MDEYRPYAGIGSRETPKTICKMMSLIAYGLGLQGYTCRSGGADGADTAFWKGAKRAYNDQGARFELFLPWPGFNGSFSGFSNPPAAAHEIAKKYHPGYTRLTGPVQKLMARNAQQIQGKDLTVNSKFVICWTPDGCKSKDTRSDKTGGTGQAIVHAESLGIPIFNLALKEDYQHFFDYLKSQKIHWSMTFEEAHADLSPEEPSASTKAYHERKKNQQNSANKPR